MYFSYGSLVAPNSFCGLIMTGQTPSLESMLIL
uniref:Uncharacterized protein n=1 Tax=Arundo donax TaxID=35708 RepID=A0A0A9FTK0_ARUDO